jgi:hypothetical protein
MASPHVSHERLHALMFDGVDLSEEEDAHLAGLGCPECSNAILEIVSRSMKRSNTADLTDLDL